MLPGSLNAGQESEKAVGNFFRSPSGCLISFVRLCGMMITQAKNLIRAALKFVHFQKLSQNRLTAQAEFNFESTGDDFLVKPKASESIHLNLAERDPSRLLGILESAFSRAPAELTIELIGPGILLHDNALMLFEEIQNRPAHTRLHVRARTCLVDGAILLWLAGDTRSMRADGWIQLSAIPAIPTEQDCAGLGGAILIDDEDPAHTDLRAVVSHIDEWLPVQEIAGLRLFERDLRGFGLLDEAASEEQLAAYFYPKADDADCPAIASPILPTQSLQR